MMIMTLLGKIAAVGVGIHQLCDDDDDDVDDDDIDDYNISYYIILYYIIMRVMMTRKAAVIG